MCQFCIPFNEMSQKLEWYKLGYPQDQERQAADVTIQDFSSGFIISWQENGLRTNLVFMEDNQWQTP